MTATSVTGPGESFAYVGADIPRELVAAAGLTPVRLAGTPVAGADSLPANLAKRSLSLAAQLLDPAASFRGAAIAHGCAEDVQLFAVIRELVRQGWEGARPVSFVDLLHAPDAATTAYNRARLDQFRAALETLTGSRVSESSLADAIAAANRQKAALSNLFARRRTAVPSMTGVEALNLVRAVSQAPLREAEEAIAAVTRADRAPLLGPRLLVTGSAHESARLYELIETQGAVIVGEDHDWGDLWLDGLVDETLSPMEALARRPQTTPFDGPTRSSAQRAGSLAQRAADLEVDGVVHLRIGGDEAAPWDLKATRAALAMVGVPLLSLSGEAEPSPQDADVLAQRIAEFLGGGAEARELRPPARSDAKPAAKTRPPEDAGRRSRKALACTRDFSEWQRNWFGEVRQRALSEPFAVVNADAPQEILRAMDVPYVVNQWWAAIVAAKQKGRDYAGLLKRNGYPANVEAYSAQGLAAALDSGSEDAPWGGLPTPDLLGVVTNSDAGRKLFEAWSQETGARLDLFERSVESRWEPPVAWWDDMPTRWATSLEPERLDLMVAQLEQHVATVEAVTGEPLDRARLVEVMTLVNEQEEYYRRTRDLIAAARPAPIGISDSMPATMTPQWHRGTPWGRDAARRLYEEVAERIAAGEAACPGERLRLMWIGRGLWSDMGFYQRWEDSHGAVFVWSMYLGLAADGYIRAFEGEHDVMRALAARFLTMGDELRMPTWAGAWHVKEAKLHGVHGAVAIDDADPLVLEALRRAGVPVCRVEMNNMTASGSAVEDQITTFIEGLSPTNS